MTLRTRIKRRAASDIDREYIAWLHTQPCRVCWIQGTAQRSPTEAAHVGDRGLGQKCPDRQAIPLCGEHHRTGRDVHHVLGKRFWPHHRLNKEMAIKRVHRLYAEYQRQMAA